ncbi:MAG TPA: serine protease, partial [Tianweitania sediminis]|nr:serine protease [Tianweitania sediminis]
MSKSNMTTRARLFAAAASIGIIAGAGAGAITAGTAPVFAEPVRVESTTATPGFGDVVERVTPAVVSVLVKGGSERASAGPAGPSQIPGFE